MGSNFSVASWSLVLLIFEQRLLLIAPSIDCVLIISFTYNFFNLFPVENQTIFFICLNVCNNVFFKLVKYVGILYRLYNFLIYLYQIYEILF